MILLIALTVVEQMTQLLDILKLNMKQKEAIKCFTDRIIAGG